MHRTPLVLLALAPLLTACADWERGAYEGLRKRDEILTQPGQPERTAPLPDYDRYRKEKP
ncbi:MAG TPA: hypothetical protein PLQ64_10075 [Thiobacillaceae bacterium]|nr:hypothetical protein [Thiobacillaceae bacterium]HNA82808.1 hypothetical protein [Thiobacillaceae bacterium]HNH90506.1 hypothetical protein [Thiobacillaceae bacterium]